MPNYLIAGLNIKIDAPLWVLHENLSDFKVDSVKHNIICNICFDVLLKEDILIKNSEPFVKTSGTSIYNRDGTIINISGDSHDIPACVTASNNYAEWKMYIPPDYSSPSDKNIIQSVKEGILSALREIMIIALSQNRGLLLHSCSMLWEGKVIAFSGKSGVGKSTHARLWQKKYGVSILDGDVTACRAASGLPIAYGLPWCGTSEQFMNQSGDLRAVVFLQQAERNSIRKLDFKEAYMYLASRCFILPWSDDLANNYLDIIRDLAASTEFYLLDCLPDYEAVEMVKECLGLK